MRSALLTPILWGAPSDGETGEGGRKSRGRGLRKTPMWCFRFVYSHLPQSSLNSPRLSPAHESGREEAACAVPEPRALRAARGEPRAPVRPARGARGRGAFGCPGRGRALGAGPAAASRWRGKHMDSPGARRALPALR